MLNIVTQNKIYLSLACIIFLIYAVLVATLFLNPTVNNTATQSPSINTPTSTLTPTPFTLPARLEQKRPLSTLDEQVKNNLTADIREGVKNVYIGENAILTYIEDTDSFQMRTKTDNLNEAKAETLTFLRNQGFSNEGICALVIDIHIPPQLLEKFSDENSQYQSFLDTC